MEFMDKLKILCAMNIKDEDTKQKLRECLSGYQEKLNSHLEIIDEAISSQTSGRTSSEIRFINQFEELTHIVGIIFRSENESVFEKAPILVRVAELLSFINEHNTKFQAKMDLIDDNYHSDDYMILDDLKKEQGEVIKSSFEKNKEEKSY